MSGEVNLDWRGDSSPERLPPSDHHVEYALAAQHGFDGLLPVLAGQVNVVDLQQPVVHPVRKTYVLDFNHCSAQAGSNLVHIVGYGISIFQVWGLLVSGVYLNRPSARLPLSTLLTNTPQSPGK